jgi:N4-gp56 family major capsid protein
MANAYTATTDMNTIPVYYNKSFIERLIPQITMRAYCQAEPLPANSGKVIYFPKISNSSTTVSAYKGTEGTVVSTEKVVDTQISATIETYRNAKAIWDIAKLTALNGYIDEAVSEQADQASIIIDKRILQSAYGTSATPLGAGFSVQFADWSTGSDYSEASAIGALTGTSRTITTAMIRKWVKILRGRNVKPLEDNLYALIVHSDTEMAVQADTTWQNAYFYTDPENPLSGIFGKYGGCKMIRDNNIYTSANGSSGATLYYNVLLGKGALAITELDGGIKTFMKESGPQDTSNPANEFITFSWKVFFVPKILNVSSGLICVTADQ